MTHATLHRARLTRYDPELHTKVVSGIGHFWTCERCGEHGKIRDYHEAQAERRIHVCADLSASGGAEAS